MADVPGPSPRTKQQAAVFASPAMAPGVENSAMSTSMFADLSDGSRETYGASYRSVAFGTWKVGEARRFTAEKFARRHRTPDHINSNCHIDKLPQTQSSEKLHSKLDTYKSQPKLVIRGLLAFDKFEEPQSSKSQPCSPFTTKRPLKKQTRLVKQNEHVEEMTAGDQANGDCYSSTEYVQFATARNTYENVLVGISSQLQRQSLLLNRSMDALNERIVNYPTDTVPTSDYRNLPILYDLQQPGTSTARLGSGKSCGTLSRNWRVRTSTVMPREYVIDSGPLCTVNGRHPALASIQNQEQQKRYRAKSLENTNRVSTAVLPNKLKRASSKQPEDLNNKSALQSAKNFLRRLYNTSTLRLRGRNGRKMDAEQRFQMAMAPFYEPRRPDFNEIPFLPYNIRYEVENEEDEGAIYDLNVLSTPASSASSATTANNSPDEGIDGMFSAGEDTNSTRSSAISSTNGMVSARSPLHNSCLYHHRPGSGLSLSTASSSNGPNSSFSSAFMSGNAYSITSPRRQVPVIIERFRNWNELFDHLKKEMNEIRARDNRILRDLKSIEKEMEIVKQTAAA